MKIRKLFSEADLAAIKQATAAAETRTGGEIVPYIVERVIDHAEARWRGAALGAMGLALLAGVVHALEGFWGGHGVWWITLPALTGGGIGYVAAGFDAVGRRLLPQDQIERAVRLRAEAAFLEEEVFNTRDRTGVLVMLALAEHQAVIIGDEGINRAVPEGEWQRLVDDLVAGIKAGRAAAAMEETIARCGEVLVSHRVKLRQDDEDELADAPRLREH
jgi:putative membrane protein